MCSREIETQGPSLTSVPLLQDDRLPAGQLSCGQGSTNPWESSGQSLGIPGGWPNDFGDGTKEKTPR